MAELRILVVDDEELILHVLKQFFRQRRDQCDTAGNGIEALRLVEDRIYDLVLSDISMPGMDGLELIRRVKALQPHAICILMSGLGTRRDILAALKIGVFDFIDKPIPDLASLTMVVDRAAESRRLTQERDALLEGLKQQNGKLEYGLQRLQEAFGQLRQQEEVIESDLLRAQRVQRKFLPSSFPRLNDLDLFGYYAPCEQLGGDFFGSIPLPDGQVALYLVDVAGHGVSAAMVTVTFRELMRARWREKDGGEFFQHPSQVLKYLNAALLEESFDPPIFVSMIYTVIDSSSGHVVMASAGHPAPIFSNEAHTASPALVSGCVLGSRAPVEFIETEVQLQSGDLLVLYSDGLSESRSTEGKEFSAEKLQEIADLRRLSSAAEIGQHIEHALARHLEGNSRSDDVTFIIAARHPLTIPSSENVPTHDSTLPDSVKILMPEKLRHAHTDTSGIVTGGWREDVCLIRLAGIATWPLAPALREMIALGKERSPGPLHIDLAACTAMDSTLLGLLLQHASELVFHQPMSRVVSQMHEMGLLPLFNISHEKCVTADTPMAVAPSSTQQACSELILSAHEALMAASESNRQRFKSVVDTMKAKPVDPEKPGSPSNGGGI